MSIPDNYGSAHSTPMIAELKRLREHCLQTVAGIDAILPEAEEFTSPVGKNLPLVVAGRCTAISLHAIARFRERTGSKKSDATVCERLAERLSAAQEMALKPKFRVIELLAHGTPAQYWRSHDIMFVVEAGLVITIHLGEADRWVPKAESEVKLVPVEVKIRPLPKALYSCCHCETEYSWPAEDLFWADALERWVCRECWDCERHGEQGETLADAVKKQSDGL